MWRWLTSICCCETSFGMTRKVGSPHVLGRGLVHRSKCSWQICVAINSHGANPPDVNDTAAPDQNPTSFVATEIEHHARIESLISSQCEGTNT